MSTGLTTYTHTQSTPSLTWTINHNLGRVVNIDTIIDLNGSQETVHPLSIVMDPDLNQVIVSWNTLRTGKAIIR